MSQLFSHVKTIADDVNLFTDIMQRMPKESFSVAEFNSGDEGAGETSVTLIEKPLDLPLAQIFVQLWCRCFIRWEEWDHHPTNNVDEVWPDTLGAAYMHEDFKKRAYRGAFSYLNRSAARQKINQLMQNVLVDSFSRRGSPYKRFSTNCFGKIRSAEDVKNRFLGVEVVQAFAIMTDWNETSVFFETEQDFGYIEWGTSC